MKAAAKHKGVTSGRLTRGGKAQPARKQAAPDPRPSASPAPAYSLYSTDSEDQVTALHRGLDACAALLGGILQADEAGQRSPPVTGGAAKPRPATSAGKKSVKELPGKRAQRSSPSCPRGAPRATHVPAAAHSGVRLRPPQKKPRPLAPFPRSAPTPPPPPQTSVLLSVLQSSSRSGQLPPRHTDCSPAPEAPPTCGNKEHHSKEEEEEEESVPVRDVNSRPVETSATHLGPGQDDQTAQDTHSRARTAQYLLGELRALAAGQGSVAERLLSPLERTRERESQQEMETLCNSQVAALRDELAAAQSQLRELGDDLAELRKALEDTRGRLTRREAENAALTTDLEATRGRLADAEREKGELASLAQRRLKEIEKLNSVLLSRDSSDCPTLVDGEASGELRCGRRPPEPAAAERVAQYLMSLGRPSPTHPEHASTSELKKPTDAPLDQSRRSDETKSGRPPPPPRLLDWTLSRCDWSVGSGSTFDTRDEAAFRDGLEALDASIASLQKTLQLDLRR